MSDFFEPDQTYIRNAPYQAPELLDIFQCVAVAPSPRNGEARAFGFAKAVTDADDGWYSTAMTPEVWSRGWVQHAPEKADG